MTLEFHPAANEFPMMDEKRFSELKADIERHGLREPVTICDGQILDGRNRFRACAELGIDPPTKLFAGDPWAYVWSLNGERRDIVGEQRYLIWKSCGEKSKEWRARQERIKAEANRKRSEAAKGQPRTPDGKRLAEKPRSICQRCGGSVLLGQEHRCRIGQVVGQSVPLPADRHKSKTAKAAASKTNTGAVARGDKLAASRPDLAEKVRMGEMKPAEAHRQMKRDAVSEKVAALPDGKYRVIYADPPWSYNDKQAVKGDFGTGTGAAEGHYPSMSTSEICAMPIQERTATDAVLFLWATSPLLPDGLKVMAAWGFTYKACFIWDKVKHNMGHYNSVRHELLLIGTKGSCTPDVVKLFDSVQSIERTKHSEKPEEFRNIIDTLYTHGVKLELFARKQVDGWSVYGNEVN